MSFRLKKVVKYILMVTFLVTSVLCWIEKEDIIKGSLFTGLTLVLLLLTVQELTKQIKNEKV